MATLMKIAGSDKAKATAVYLGLAVGVVASLGAVVMSAVNLAGAAAGAVYVMAGVCMANVPYAAHKETRIAKLPGLRLLNNTLRADAQRLEVGVDTLEKSIDELTPQAKRAGGVKEELERITATQGGNVDKLVALCKENARTIAEMKENLRQRIVQDVLKIVLDSDRDGDSVFSPKETNLLFLKMDTQLKQDGILLDEEKFRRVISKNPTVTEVFRIVQRLVPSLNEGDDDGLDPEEEEDYDMFRVADNGVNKGSLGGYGRQGSLSSKGSARSKGKSRRGGLASGSQKAFRDTMPGPGIGLLPSVV